ncbi:SDR family oxidoreductase [Kordiimonas gwangyangensis]|uniref:SDR family oxidoreductase n=1 Tax=Kordiimonas gwangyangensis TaxID=288022 RepID=UPI000370FD1E|nr:SDR family oxidoreductase [Kordiimonas gwangyangensis]
MKRAPRTVLVTGAARRIGRAIAQDLAAQGWHVAVHYHGSTDDADMVVEEIEAFDGRAVAVKADLSDAAETLALVQNAAEALGAPLAALVNNASLFEDDRIDTFTPESWHAHMSVNLLAPAILTQQFAAQLADGVSGNVINMIDQRVLKLNPQYLSYTTSKAGLMTLTRTTAQALAPRIRVNAIGPGPTLPNHMQGDDMFAREASSVLLGYGPNLTEICAAVRFLLETQSITGQMIALDGGQHLAWRTADILED